jgi:opacity protein-like surface antigen
LISFRSRNIFVSGRFDVKKLGITLAAVAVASFGAPSPAMAQGGYSGPYIGITAMYGRGAIDATIVRGTQSVSANVIENGLAIAGTLGYDHKISGLVIGAAADLATTKFGDSQGGLLTVRGRAGVLVTPATLLYATGGVAYLKNDMSGNLGGHPYSLSGWVPGWVAGGGIEQRFVWGTQPMRLGVEGLYVAVNDRHFSVPQRHATVETRAWSFGGRVSFELYRDVRPDASPIK